MSSAEKFSPCSRNPTVIAFMATFSERSTFIHLFLGKCGGGGGRRGGRGNGLEQGVCLFALCSELFENFDCRFNTRRGKF